MPLTTSHRNGPRAVHLLFACAASLGLHGCWWDDNVTAAATAQAPPPAPAPTPAPAPAPASYTVGGGITGLTAAGLILANGTDTVSPAANATSFAFTQPVVSGGTYSVTVTQQPTGQTCAVAGTFPATVGSANVTNVAVSCQATGALSLLAGQAQCPSPPNVDGTGAAASIPGMASLASDAAGNLYAVGNYASGLTTLVTKITPAGVVSTIAGQYGVSGYSDGPVGTALFSGPGGVGVDSSGTVYVVDNGTRIRSISTAGIVATFAGSLFGGYLDATGGAALFSGVNDTVVDSHGNVFVSDASNGRIRKITPAGVVTTFAGGGGSSAANAYGLQDGLGTQALFYIPAYLAIDSSDTLFVSDQSGAAIRKITSDGNVTTLAGGAFGTRGFANGTGSAAQFNGIGALAVGPAGVLYVLDQDNFSITGGSFGFRAVRQVGVSGAVTSPFQANVSPAPGVTVLSSLLQGMTTDKTGALVFGIGCSLQKVGP